MCKKHFRKPIKAERQAEGLGSSRASYPENQPSAGMQRRCTYLPRPATWDYSKRGWSRKLAPGVGIESKRESEAARALLNEEKRAKDGERPGFEGAARRRAGALRAQNDAMTRHGQAGEHAPRQAP
jgi:hypothetical protein